MPMPLSQEQLVDTLNDLLETCYDGLEGFRVAASTVVRPEAIMFCQSRAQRIDEAAAELYTEIRRHGGQPADHGHGEARLHRGWMHLRAALAERTDDAVLAEVERGEHEAVRRYRHALTKDLPPDIHDLLADQLTGAEESLTSVRALRQTRIGA
jgi:uncharacterized protein (TIGR02284 family)